MTPREKQTVERIIKELQLLVKDKGEHQGRYGVTVTQHADKSGGKRGTGPKGHGMGEDGRQK